MKKYYKYFVLVATLTTIFVNFLAGVGQINNVTPQVLADSFPVFFIPEGYVFSIWFLIYIGIVLYSFYQFRDDQKSVAETRVLYIVSALANISWIFLWHYNHPVLSVLPMIVLLLSLLQIYRRLGIGKRKVERDRFWMVHVPFSLYLGWISIATMANITVALYVLGFQGLGISGENWSALLIILATILGLHMYLKRMDLTFLLVILWSITGIGIKFQDIGIISFVSFISILIFVATILFRILAKHEDKLILKEE